MGSELTKLSIATLHNSNISSVDVHFIIFNTWWMIQLVMLDRLIHLDQLPMVPSDQGSIEGKFSSIFWIPHLVGDGWLCIFVLTIGIKSAIWFFPASGEP